MSNPKPPDGHAEVTRAVKLLQMRGAGDPVRKVAVERKIQQLPDHVHAAAQARVHTGTKHKAKPPTSDGGAVTFEPDVITVTKADQAQYKADRGEAQTAIGREVDRYVKAVEQGHRQGYADFRNWYRKWEKAKEDSDAELAKKICGFILEAGLDIIFPEEEVLIVILKKAAAKAYEVAADQLSKAGIPKGNIEEFLDTVWAAEEHGITTQLDVHDQFFDSKAPEVQAAIDSFINARLQGWDSTEKLPAETIEILKNAGVGAHGAAAANVIAERVLSAHIQSVLRADSNVTFAASSAADISVMAEIAALRQVQSLPSVDNRDRIWTLERRLPDMYRTMCDINHDAGIMIHIRLGIDKDKGEDIAASREKEGLFTSSNDLLTRKLLGSDELRVVEGQVVCY
jgi:hypothetical protein